MSDRVTQFSGENNWQAIVNDRSLDMVEEESFARFVEHLGHGKDAALNTLDTLHAQWWEVYETEAWPE